MTWKQKHDLEYVEFPDDDDDPLTSPRINITEGQLLKVECTVRYPTKMPSVQLLVANTETSEIIENVTSYFSPVYDTYWRVGMSSGFLNSTFGVSYESQPDGGFYPNYTHDVTMLVCKASSGITSLFDRIVLNVHCEYDLNFSPADLFLLTF